MKEQQDATVLQKRHRHDTQQLCKAIEEQKTRYDELYKTSDHVARQWDIASTELRGYKASLKAELEDNARIRRMFEGDEDNDLGHE